MKLTWKDLIATALVAAIGVPYVWFLTGGDVWFIEDERGMSAVGLLLAAVAFVVLRYGDVHDRISTFENVAVAISLGLGILALVLAETSAAAALLAVFMGSVLVVWAVEVADHVGLLPGHATHQMSPRHR